MLGKIYKLTPHKCCEFYIGSTIDMELRERQHTTQVEISNSKLYKTIRECGGGYNMEVLYEYECVNETELRMEEQRCMDKMKPTLNTYRAFCSEEYITEYQKQYYEQNKDVLDEKQKQYNEQNKEVRRAKQKQYNEQNKDVIRAKNKKYYQESNYYENNKDKSKKYYQQNRKLLLQTITCECGCVVVKKKLNRHKQTKKHINLMEQQQS